MSTIASDASSRSASGCTESTVFPPTEMVSTWSEVILRYGCGSEPVAWKSGS